MERITLRFGKDKTAIIKGIAIIMMIVLHCGGQDWFDREIPAFTAHPSLTTYFSVCKLCVGIFAFMVGYGYAFASKKDWHYSWSHIKKLLIPFWTILFVFTFPVAWYNGELRELNVVILNLFGINSSLNWLSWFVSFFIYAMIVMPFMSRIIDRWQLLGTIILITFTFVLEVSIRAIPNWSGNDWTQRAFDCMVNSPGMLLGYLFARKEWFCKIDVLRHWSMAFLALFGLSVIFVLRYHIGSIAGFNLDFFYAPLFILAVLVLFNLYSLPIFVRILTALGNASVYMWFFHALFFTKSVRNIYQPLIMVSDNLWLIILWTIALSFACSWCINALVETLFEKMPILLKKGKN